MCRHPLSRAREYPAPHFHCGGSRTRTGHTTAPSSQSQHRLCAPTHRRAARKTVMGSGRGSDAFLNLESPAEDGIVEGSGCSQPRRKPFRRFVYSKKLRFMQSQIARVFWPNESRLPAPANSNVPEADVEPPADKRSPIGSRLRPTKIELLRKLRR